MTGPTERAMRRALVVAITALGHAAREMPTYHRELDRIEQILVRSSAARAAAAERRRARRSSARRRARSSDPRRGARRPVADD